MKKFSNGLILACLAAAMGGAGVMGLPVSWLAPFTPAVAVAQTAAVPVSLPELAVITLKDGGERSGKVVGFDSQKQTLLLQRGSASASTPLNQIAKVVYAKDAPFYRAQGEPVIRGNPVSQAGSVATWSNVPLSSFQVTDASRGQATVMLDAVLSSSQLPGVRAVAGSSTYVVDEMQFNLQQRTMTVSVTPY